MIRNKTIEIEYKSTYLPTSFAELNAALNCTTHILSPHMGVFSSNNGGLLALVLINKNNNTENKYFILIF